MFCWQGYLDNFCSTDMEKPLPSGSSLFAMRTHERTVQREVVLLAQRWCSPQEQGKTDAGPEPRSTISSLLRHYSFAAGLLFWSMLAGQSMHHLSAQGGCLASVFIRANDTNEEKQINHFFIYLAIWASRHTFIINNITEWSPLVGIP